MGAAVEQKRAVLAKIETTYGTDPVPTGAANAMIVESLNWTPLVPDYAPRTDVAMPYLGTFSSKTAQKRGKIEFDVELTGASAAGTAPPFGPLLRACGLGETIVAVTSVTYAPISSAFEGVTIYANIDGMRQALVGCRGTASLKLRNRLIPHIHFAFEALYAVPTDTALPALTLSSWQAPLPVNKTNTTASALHGYTFGLEEVDLDIGNAHGYVSFPNGSEQVFITGRQSAGRVMMEHPTLAQKDYFTIVGSAATGTLSVVHGTVAGAICTITAAQARLTAPQRGQQGGVSTLQLGLELAPSVAGNDEFSIAFT